MMLFSFVPKLKLLHVLFLLQLNYKLLLGRG